VGLDNFQGDNPQSPKSGGSRSPNKKKNKRKNKDPYKVVGVGSVKKVFVTEKEWNITVAFIENVMGFDIDEVMSMRDKYRHMVLHEARMRAGSSVNPTFETEHTCFVCGHTFEFPHDWDYKEYKQSAVCGSHEYNEILDSYAQNRGEYLESE